MSWTFLECKPLRVVWALMTMSCLDGCSESYRIGDHVLVMWNDQGPYPAYILEKKGARRYRVHFEGYPERCDDDILIDKVVGKANDAVVPPDGPTGVSCVRPKPEPNSLAAADYREGDKVRVNWRGSPYPAVIVKVVSRDRFLVHYEGHEDQWDETVPLERVVGKR